MADELTIVLANLPEEGKTFEGELGKKSLETSGHDVAQPHSPFYYDLHVQRFDNELLVRGYLEATMRLCCARCSKDFLQTTVIEEFTNSVEITSGSIDLTVVMREELIFELPMTPNCEEGDEKMTCEVNSRYLTVDKPADSTVNEPPATEGEKKWSNNWDALDGFQDFSDKKD